MSGKKSLMLSFLLSITMVFTMMPAATFAEDAPVNYKLWVGGVRVTSDATSGEGWSYAGNEQKGTLTLTNAEITGSHPTSEHYAIIYAVDIELTIKLEGNNTISAKGQDETYGIDVDETLTITGAGSLNIDSTKNAIYGYDVIFDDTDVSLNSSYRGIHANYPGDVVINGGKVEVTGQTNYGISCRNLKMTDAELTMKTVRDGLELDRADIKNSVLNLESGSYDALFADGGNGEGGGEVRIENSEVNAKCTGAVAINCFSDDCDLIIIDSNVVAESNTFAIWANTIKIDNGSGSVKTYVEAKSNGSGYPAVFTESAGGITLGEGVEISTPQGGTIGDYTYSEYNGTTVYDQSGAKAAHVIIQEHDLTLTKGIAPTCTEPGASDYYTCSICGKYFSDADGKNEVPEGSWILAADPEAHAWGEWKSLDDAMHQRVCKHDSSHVEKEAHKWDSGKVTKEATETAEGEKLFTCAACGQTRTEAIPKIEPEKQPEIASAPVVAKMTAKGSKALVLKWNTVAGAEGYDVFFSRCNSANDKRVTKKVATLKGSSKKTWKKSGLKARTAYKACVKAWAMKDGKKKYISESPLVHAYTSGGNSKYTNPKSVSVKKASVSLKKGKTYKIKASVSKLNKAKKLLSTKHAATLRYLSSDKSVAKVSKTGKITAVSAGKCTVYVIAQNGAYKKIKVTVK